MNEYSIQDLMLLGITIQKVIEDMIQQPIENVELDVTLAAMGAHHHCVQMILELQKAHATKFTILPIVDTEVKTDGIEQ